VLEFSERLELALAHDRPCARIAGIDLDGAEAAFLY